MFQKIAIPNIYLLASQLSRESAAKDSAKLYKLVKQTERYNNGRATAFTLVKRKKKKEQDWMNTFVLLC